MVTGSRTVSKSYLRRGAEVQGDCCFLGLKSHQRAAEDDAAFQLVSLHVQFHSKVNQEKCFEESTGLDIYSFQIETVIYSQIESS